MSIFRLVSFTLGASTQESLVVNDTKHLNKFEAGHSLG